MTAPKIGIMGGTFNPIHHGHLLLAEQVRTEYGLDLVLFIPTGRPPHKRAIAGHPSEEQRLEMTRIAIESNAYFAVSDIEVTRPGATYTIDTVRALQEQHPNAEFVFITGADVIMELELWKQADQLFRMIRFVAAARPGTETKALRHKCAELRQQHGAKIELVEISALAISSTEIRDRVNRGKSIRYLLPESVERYVIEQRLYLVHHPDYERLSVLMRRTLSSSRYEHSIAVAETARMLAFRYGVDPLRAELAGLVHDYAKELPHEDSAALIERFGIEHRAVFVHNPNLAHGEIGAALLREQGLVTDEAVLDAVRWHTYGHARMSTLAKIVYIADLIEPTRGPYPVVLDARRAALSSLDEAIRIYVNYQRVTLAEKGLVVHPNMEAMVLSLEDAAEVV